MPEPLRETALEPGTAAGVSRRRFLGAVAAGSAGALLAGGAPRGEARASIAAIEKAQGDALPEEDFWTEVRGEFLISDELAYMNSGTLGPMPKPVFYAVVDGYRALAARLRDRLRQIPGVTLYASENPELCCGLTGFALEGFDRVAVVDTLWRRNRVWVRETDYGLNTVRASTHHYNTEDQVDRLADGIHDIFKEGTL